MTALADYGQNYDCDGAYPAKMSILSGQGRNKGLWVILFSD